MTVDKYNMINLKVKKIIFLFAGGHPDLKIIKAIIKPI